MVVIQIPRVPLSGVVVMQLEDVSRSSQDFAAGLLVPDRCEHRAVVPLHAQHFVLDCVIRYGYLGFGSEWMRRDHGPSAGRSDDAHVGRPDPRQLPPPVRSWVEHRRALPVAANRPDGVIRHSRCALHGQVEVALGLLVDPVDARAGQDVVELIQQHALPCFFQLGPSPRAGRNRPHLRLA